ncbi:MAG: STAUR_1299 family protein [Myxococcota bacterium]
MSRAEGRLALLLAEAEEAIPGLQATLRLAEVRDALEAELGRATIVELVLEPSDLQDLHRLIDGKLRRLSAFLRQKQFATLGGTGAMIALWSNEVAYLFAASRLFAAVAEALPCSLDALKLRLERTDGGPVLALPGPTGPSIESNPGSGPDASTKPEPDKS